jgi:hypothetical protein
MSDQIVPTRGTVRIPQSPVPPFSFWHDIKHSCRHCDHAFVPDFPNDRFCSDECESMWTDLSDPFEDR